jgi:hypothetical protein
LGLLGNHLHFVELLGLRVKSLVHLTQSPIGGNVNPLLGRLENPADAVSKRRLNLGVNGALQSKQRRNIVGGGDPDELQTGTLLRQMVETLKIGLPGKIDRNENVGVSLRNSCENRRQ